MYTFSDESMKQLKYVLDTFKAACKHIDSSKVDYCNSATDYDTESSYNPHKFFHFQFRDKFCQIERLGRSFRYVIRCHGFKPVDLINHYELSSDFDFYNELYGDYDNLDNAIQDFSRISSEICKFTQSVFIF